MDGSRRTADSPRPTADRPWPSAASVAAHLVASCVIGLVLWLASGRTSFVNYDSAWSLNWAREVVAGGDRPDLTRLFSPTPHPLSDLFSALLVPLSDAGGTGAGAVGRGAESAVVVFALFWLGALGVVTFRLGAAWFGTAAGVVAAILVLTREPVLSYGLRSYLDLPYAVFLLLALLAETRRPRNGWRTMAWITLAGLLRPEAWLLAAAYVGYLVVAQATGRGAAATAPRPARRLSLARVGWRGLVPLVALSLVAPVGWLLEGLVLAGDPLQALTGTQQNAADLDRVTGVGSAVTVMPRRLGEIVREPVLLAAVGGAVLSLWLLRRRALLGVGAGIAAAVAFFVLAAAGLPLLTRYLVFPATLLIVFAAAGLLGWRLLPAGDRRRRPWQAFAALALVAFVVFTPSQVDRLDRLQNALALQERVIDDLRTVTGDVVRPALADACGRRRITEFADVDGPGGPGSANAAAATYARQRPDVALPNHRAVPQVLLWLGRERGTTGAEPTVNALEPGARPQVTLIPSSERVARGFILDRADRGAGLPRPPAGAVRAGTLGTWTVYGDDAGCAAALRDRLATAVR
ncbi:hypothetical protein [Patulibacter americanus]|uniref:hypothetical protein n=1 Tax=Patulibacter americanus TaxID=588672 RepID=UPI0003B35E62|nr:hypothetical protein [Patulibacter americanus]